MNINICGRREEGKTTLAKYLAMRRHRAVVAFDPRGMIDGKICYGPEELQDAIDHKEWQNAMLVYRYDSQDASGEFEQMSAVLFPPRFKVGAFAVIVDEASELQTSNSVHPELKRIVKQHPTKPPEQAVTIIQTTHRLADFNGSSKALMDELYIFNTSAPRDLIAIEDHTGSTEIPELVRQLKKHQCLRYKYSRQADGEMQYEVWDDPSVWYSPLEKTSQEDDPESSAKRSAVKEMLW